MITRREFVSTVAVGGVAAAGLSAPALGRTGRGRASKIRAIAFDAFPVFDPRPIFTLAEELFPGRGSELSEAWRTRQFEYTWLRVVARRYADFWNVTRDALVFAAAKLGLELSDQSRDRLMNAYLSLGAWPDAGPALRELAAAGYRLGFLSNFIHTMLTSSIRHAGLEGVFEHVLSTDAARTYKPDPGAYSLGVEAFGLERDEVLFVAFAGWDAAGAAHFGYPTFWVNRLGLPPEELGEGADGVGKTLTDLVKYLA